MKVGDYIRTKYGIAQIISTNVKDEDGNNVLQVDKMLEPYFCGGCDELFCDCKDVIKSSPNIIGLIEVGDYVNGEKVTDKFDYLLVFGNADYYKNEQDIKSIVTKEQFESMQYEVEVC